MEENKLVCFDVDGTLTEDKTSFITITKNLGCSVNDVLAVYNDAMAGRISFPEGEKAVANIFRARGKATKEFISHIFDGEPFKPGAAEIVDFLKEAGYKIWLVSGAIDIRVATVAEKLKADGFYAHASLEFDAHGVLSKINYGGDQNPWKAQKVCQLSEKYGIPLNRIIFVGDGENDVEAFKIARGVAIYPYDEKLAPIAWKKIDALLDLKYLLK